MRKEYGWKDSAKATVKNIAEMQLHSYLGLHCEPDEYLETLENYTKLLFEMNEIPQEFIEELKVLDEDWRIFKFKLRQYCRKIYEELEKDYEKPEDE